MIMLPGLEEQLNLFLEHVDVKGKDILVAGSAAEEIAIWLSRESGNSVQIIVEDFDSLMDYKLILADEKDVEIKMMEFDVTDFSDARFDVIFAQASISQEKRNSIIKEFKRILKPGGYLSVGEIVFLKENSPRFISDIVEDSGLSPMLIDKIEAYYSERNFKIIRNDNLSETLKKYYSFTKDKLKYAGRELSEDEKTVYKKYLKQISHQSNSYLKHGGDKYLGFAALILEKKRKVS